MTTTKLRINITADKDIEEALVSSAKRSGVPTASKAVELLRIALELEEDLAWVKIIEQRTAKKVKLLSHENVWR
jgi:hypothetical protein